jgi:solute carrier family 25 S-adenosylmethionine transporter 26
MLSIQRVIMLVSLLFPAVNVLALQSPKIAKSATKLLASTRALEQAPSPRSIQDGGIYIPAPTTIVEDPQRSSLLEPAVWKLALAGSIATLVSDSAMHPIDCIKTLQQSDDGFGLSMMGAAQMIYTQLGGWEGFYRGFLSYAACDAVGGAIKFGTYEVLKRQVQQRVSSEQMLSAALFACAAMSFVSSSIISVPGELLKQQLQVGHYGGFVEAASTIWETHGLAGFYQGYDSVFLRDVPYTAMELGLYDLFKKQYMSQVPRQEGSSSDFSLGTHEQVVLAGLTGGVAGFLTTPLDTIKTKLMVDVHFEGSSFMTALMATLHDHGWESLFCGGDARVAWLVPLTAIYLPTYDLVKRKLSREE